MRAGPRACEGGVYSSTTQGGLYNWQSVAKIVYHYCHSGSRLDSTLRQAKDRIAHLPAVFGSRTLLVDGHRFFEKDVGLRISF
jgi:hypothetical protein